jgi:hypothetical protein
MYIVLKKGPEYRYPLYFEKFENRAYLIRSGTVHYLYIQDRLGVLWL